MTGKSITPLDQQAFNTRLIMLLETLAIPYAIGGSVAAMVYSETRNTIDIDLMIQIELDDLDKLISEIEAWKVYVDPFETVIEFNLPRQMPISIVDGLSGTKADIYVACETGIDVSAMERRQRKQFYDDAPIETWFLAPENVILYKLDYFRQSAGQSQKHPLDIAKMLTAVGDTLDLIYLEFWAKKLDIYELWSALWNEFRK